MATQNQDLRYRLLGEDVSAGRTFRKVGQEAQGARDAIRTLSNAMQSTGAFTPLLDGIDAISQGFDHIKEHGRTASAVMQGVGVAMASAGAAFLAVGARDQQAAATLKQAIVDTGNSWGDYSKRVEEVIVQQEKYGHAAFDTQDALARLTQASHDPAQALQLIGLAADVAAARHVSLTDASQNLSQALAGNTRSFRQFGIQLSGTHLTAKQLNDALNELEQRVGGTAQAQADTFSGKIRALGVHFEDMVASASKLSPLLLTVGSGLTIVGAATDMLNRKRATQVAIDGRVAVAEGEVAASEVASAEAAGAASVTGGRFAFGSGALMRAGAFAGGGLLAGTTANTLIGGRVGGTVGGVLSGAGIGAAIGTVVPGIGTLVGAGVGAAAGGLLGYFTSHSSSAAEQQRRFNLQLQQAQAAQTKDLFSGFLPGEFDQLGNPKAEKLAVANERLAKAKEHLAAAEDAVRKAQEKHAPTSESLTAATDRVTAAEANLRKARYVGGDARVASAEAALAAAQDHLNKLRDSGAGSADRLTAAERRLNDAQMSVGDARRNVRAARAGITGLTAQQFLHRQAGNLGTEQQMAADQATLVDRFHLAQPIIQAIDAANQQIPGTLHRVVQTMTRSLAEQLNRNQQQWDSAAQAFREAGARAMTDAAKALGTQLAEDQMRAYTRRLHRLQIVSPVPLGQPFTPGLQGGGLAGLMIGTVNVQANDPNAFTNQLTARARQRALAVPHGA